MILEAVESPTRRRDWEKVLPFFKGSIAAAFFITLGSLLKESTLASLWSNFFCFLGDRGDRDLHPSRMLSDIIGRLLSFSLEKDMSPVLRAWITYSFTFSSWTGDELFNA